MKLLKNLKTVILMVALFGGISAFAQAQQSDTKVSDNEVKDFAKAYTTYQQNSAQLNTKVMKVIEDNGLKAEDYQKMKMAEAQGQKVEASKEDLEKKEKVDEKVQEIAEEAQKDALKGTNLTMNRFQEIANAVQQDRDLQVKVQKAVNDLMGK